MRLARQSNPNLCNRCATKKRPYNFDKETYRARHLVENLFAKLKHMRAYATRFDKLERNYESLVLMVCIVIWAQVLTN